MKFLLWTEARVSRIVQGSGEWLRFHASQLTATK